LGSWQVAPCDVGGDHGRCTALPELVIEGNVADVLKHAATLPVRRIVTHETDLEDVFLNLYRDQP
jgi:ABC-2 type transport system ATP-binding protein